MAINSWWFVLVFFRMETDKDERWDPWLSLQQLRQVQNFLSTMFQQLSTGGVKFLLSDQSRMLCFLDLFLFSYCPWPDVLRMRLPQLLIAISSLLPFSSMWTNTGHGKLKDFLPEAHGLRGVSAPLPCFEPEMRQNILAVGAHDRLAVDRDSRKNHRKIPPPRHPQIPTYFL